MLSTKGNHPFLRSLVLGLWVLAPLWAWAEGLPAHAVPASEPAPVVSAPAESAAVRPDIEVDLKFRDFFKMPVGPRGLEPTEKLLGLNRKPVRIRGYMAHQETPMTGVFVLSPLPVEMGDEDESLADDLPPSVVFVHLAGHSGKPVSYVPGIVQVSGVLSLGPVDESDGHVSHVRLLVDPARPDALLSLQVPRQARR
jgi:hypothetical protein